MHDVLYVLKSIITFVFLSDALPADVYLVAQVRRLQRVGALLEVSDVEVRQSVIDEAVHGAVQAVHVLVDQPWDEV